MKTCWSLAALVALGSSVPVHAATAVDELRAAALAATCANCHGTQGRAIDGSVVPGLAGQPAGYLAEQLKAYKAGTRPATVMHQLARGYTDAQIDAIAAYFAAQRR